MTVLKNIALADTDDGVITVSIVTEPYGANSSDVASIGVSLDSSSEPAWKVHIPKENIDAVIEGLLEAKQKLSS